MDKELFEDVLRCPSLPTLPVVAARVLDLTMNPDVTISQIADVVQQDQALSAKVLKTVNSSYYGLSERCASIERAMGYLGLNTVKSIVLGFSLVEMAGDRDHEGFDMDGHWRRTIIGAVGAKTIAQRLRLGDSDDVFSAGLFQDIGVLALYAARKDDYTDVLQNAHDHAIPRIEKETFGFTHAQVGAELARRWNLPSKVVDPIAMHHDDDAPVCEHRGTVRAVILGALIAQVQGAEDPKARLDEIQSKFDAWFPGSRISVEGLVDHIVSDAQAIAGMLDTDMGNVRDTRGLLSRAQDAGIAHQISMQKQSEELERQAVTDGLTMLANRKQFDADLQRVHKACGDSGELFSVLFFDADRFKSVNDSHGHAAGDAVLVELARRARDEVGDLGTVYRYGGEEFAVIVRGIGVSCARELAEKIRVRVESPRFDLRKVDEAPDELRVTISVGVSGTDAGPVGRLEKAETVVLEADEAVYAAKDGGRNRVCVWGREPEEAELCGGVSSSVSTLARVPRENSSIVLIEDDALAATLVLSLLKRNGGIDVTWYKDGAEAIADFGESIERGELPCDVVLCDIEMPKASGIDVYRAFLGMGLDTEIPFIVLTAHEDTIECKQITDMGVTACIGKGSFAREVGKWLGFIKDQFTQRRAA